MKPILASLLCLLVTSARAQVDPSEQLLTCEYHNCNIHRVLSDLFAKVQISFCLDDSIQDTLSADLPPMRFDTALQKILGSCYLTYRCEGGVYQIIERERWAEEQERIDADPSSLIQTTGLPDDPAPAIHAKKENAAELLWRILTESGQHFVIGTGIHASLTADIPAQPLGKTVGFIARAAHGSMKYDSGVWTLSGPFQGPIFREGVPPPDKPGSFLRVREADKR
ncbi:MAG: hypothetical protein ACHQ50_13630 [Fimbriimonadales bacterium]